MNKVSYTIRRTVGPVPQVDAVVLGCSHETFLFIRLLAGKPEERHWTCVDCVQKERSTDHLRKNAKTGKGPILPLGHLLMRRHLRPIIITLAHPENHGGSSYNLRAQRKSKGGEEVILIKTRRWFLS